MLTEVPSLTSLAHAHDCCTDLFCLLRLSEIVIAAPERPVALRAMVDELARLARVKRAWVAATDDGGRLRYLAHRGLPGRTAHEAFTAPADTMAASALDEARLVQVVKGGLEPSGTVVLPVLAGERPCGIVGVGLVKGVPLDAWNEELFWAVADLIALVMLQRDTRRGAPGELQLTRRQRDVLFELVEHGATNAQIATTLGLSARTVKIHLLAAYRQLGVRRRGEAIRLVLTRHANWLSQERERRRRRHPG